LEEEVAKVPEAVLGAGIYCSILCAGTDHALCGMTALGKTQIEDEAQPGK
jgi:hypothetical protein